MLAATAALMAQGTKESAQAAAQAIPGLSRQPSAAARQALLDPNDTTVILLDHQTGLFQTGRKTLVMAGVWTSVCVAFPSLQAKADGYKVYAVMDASGDISQMASDGTLARMTQAGIIPVTTNTVLSESHRTWNRPDAAQWGALYAELVPNYRAVAESYRKAQQVGTEPKK